jgi:hypothetical protein
MTMPVFRLAVLLLLGLCAQSSFAFVLSGYMNDAGNTALTASDPSQPPSFADDYEIANNVALYTFSLGNAANLDFKSVGFAAGGIDPYFTLFQGAGAGAGFLASNYATAGTGDFDMTVPLLAGDYTIAISTFVNMSFAENLGSGTLGDGFIGLGEPYSLGNSFYELDVVEAGVTIPVPEPGALLLVGLALSLLAASRRLCRPRFAPMQWR